MRKQSAISFSLKRMACGVLAALCCFGAHVWDAIDANAQPLPITFYTANWCSKCPAAKSVVSRFPDLGIQTFDASNKNLPRDINQIPAVKIGDKVSVGKDAIEKALQAEKTKRDGQKQEPGKQHNDKPEENWCCKEGHHGPQGQHCELCGGTMDQKCKDGTGKPNPPNPAPPPAPPQPPAPDGGGGGGGMNPSQILGGMLGGLMGGMNKGQQQGQQQGAQQSQLDDGSKAILAAAAQTAAAQATATAAAQASATAVAQTTAAAQATVAATQTLAGGSSSELEKQMFPPVGSASPS